MFAVFNDSDFPKIYVTLNNIDNDDDFENFCNQWESYDNLKQNYTFIFNTNNVGYIPIKYAFKTSSFIASLKQKKLSNNVYLDKSIIVCNNSKIRYLLELIFFLQSPVANVYIVNSSEKAEKLYNNLKLSKDFYDSTVSVFFSN
tara:strand:+ start:5300 stop:5731 length:432 start_codon:yes stop_codon:yes gene_type:complete